MKQYLNILKEILKENNNKEDRTKVGTISKFGVQQRYDLRKGFPLLTTKKVYFKAILVELLWFIRGNTNIKYLVDNNVNIWNEWPYQNFTKSKDYKNETLAEFVEKIKNDVSFAKKYGDLGPVYGKQWRDFNGVDQFKKLIENLKKDPNSRRHIVSAWNPNEVDKMLLPPCHTLFQLYVAEDKYLDLQMYQRSADMFLGAPFNIASYSLLLILIAREVNLIPRYFIHTIGDAHIYKNHIEQVKCQIQRKPYKLSNIEITSNKNIFEIDHEDIILKNYKHHSKIVAPIAV
ncbi:thymidylate synthase [Spiroplasma endosymbiont of Crioceris asparagi]|uniref:thymidylate synthase n=1 Tax=Spiroplasma endosymbiont of Crioceris asparagi TaxID=3066286 RepID=UPI0030CAC614